MQDVLVVESSTMKRIRFGAFVDSGEPATFDLEALIGTRLLDSANSGGGKSWLIRKLLEASHGKVQQIILDLEAEFATLREKFDYLLVASKDYDVKLDSRTCELLAKTVLENPGTSVIIDLSELKDQERKHYVKLFLEALVNAPRELWHPVLVVVDEAHHFDPEGQESESTGAVNDLMTRGRKRGLCGCLATQRLSKLNKDAAAEANNVLIGRTTLDIDQKRASDILGFTSKEQGRSLRDLEPGQFYCFGPAFAPGVNLVKVGPVETTHPKVGMKALVSVPPPASEKIKSVLSRFADVNPQKAEVDLRDRQETAKRIRGLEHELRVAKSQQGSVAPERLKEIEDRGFHRGVKSASEIAEKRLKALESLASRSKRVFESIAREATEAAAVEIPRAGEHVRTITTEGKTLGPKVSVGPATPSMDPTRLLSTRRLRNEEGASSSIDNEALGGDSGAPTTPTPRQETEERPLKDGAVRMLRAAAQFDPRPITREQMGTLAGFSTGGGTFQDYLGQLRRRGLISERGADVTITEAGRELVGDVEPLSTDPQALLEMWIPKFKAGAGKMLREVATRYPDSISKQDLGERSGYASSGGTFQDYLGQLRRSGLIVVEGDQVRASETLFPEGFS